MKRISTRLSAPAQRAIDSYDSARAAAADSHLPSSLHPPQPPHSTDDHPPPPRKGLIKSGWLSNTSRRVAPQPPNSTPHPPRASASSTASPLLEPSSSGPQPPSCDVDYLHSPMSRITGCFQPELEARFRDYYQEAYGINLRRATIVGVLMWLILGTLHDINAAVEDDDWHELVVLISVRVAGFGAGLLYVLLFRWLPLENLLSKAPWLTMTAAHCLAMLALVQFSALESATAFWRGATFQPSYVLLLILLPSLSATMLRNAHVITFIYSFLFLLLFLVLTLIDGQYDPPYLFTVTVSIFVVHCLYTLHSYRENLRTRREFLQFCHLQQEQELHQRLLQKMLPLSIIGKLKAGAEYVYERYDQVSVLFSHIHDFDLHTASMQPLQLVRTLNKIFSMFDQLTDEHHVYKVETIGDCFLVSSGCPSEYAREDHAAALCVLAVDMMSVVKVIKVLHDEARRTSLWHLATSGSSRSLLPTSSASETAELRRPSLRPYPSSAVSHSRLDLRIGINTGPVIAGVVGVKYPRYRLMGDTINTASRMSTTCDAGEIQLAASTYAELNSADFICDKRKEVQVKGKGLMQTYILQEHLLPHRISATRVQLQQGGPRVDSPSKAASSSFSFAKPPRGSPFPPSTGRVGGDKASPCEPLPDGERPSVTVKQVRMMEAKVLMPFTTAPHDELEATIRAKSAQVAHLMPSSHRMSVSYPAEGGKEGEGVPLTAREELQTRSEPTSQLLPDGVAPAPSPRRPATAPMSPMPPELLTSRLSVEPLALSERTMRAASVTFTPPDAVAPSLPLALPLTFTSSSRLPESVPASTSTVLSVLKGTPSSTPQHPPSSSATPASNTPPKPAYTDIPPPVMQQGPTVPLSSLAMRLTGGSSISYAPSTSSTATTRDSPSPRPPTPTHPTHPPRPPLHLPSARSKHASLTEGHLTPTSSTSYPVDRSPTITPREPLVHADGSVTLLRTYNSVKLPPAEARSRRATTTQLEPSTSSYQPDLLDSPVSRRMSHAPPEPVFLRPSALTDAGMEMTPRTRHRFLMPSPSKFDRTGASPSHAGFAYPVLHTASPPVPSSRARASMSGGAAYPPTQPPSSDECAEDASTVEPVSKPAPLRKFAKGHRSYAELPVLPAARRRPRDVVITAHSDRVKTAKMFTYGDADALLDLPRPLWNRLSQTFYTAPALEEDFQAEKAEREKGTTRWWLVLLMSSLLPCAVWETVAVQLDGGMSVGRMIAVWTLRLAAVAMGGVCYRVVGDERRRAVRPLVIFATNVLWTVEFIVANVVESTFDSLYGLSVLLFTLSVTTMFLALPLQLTALYAALSMLVWVASTLLMSRSVDPIILLHLFACVLYLASSYSSEYRDRLAYIRFVRHANEKTTTENFLANLLPKVIIDSLTLSKQPFIAHERVSADVLFCDVVQFTALAARSSPEDVVAILNVLFSSFDAMTDKYHVYKVETIGDAYLACSGVVEEREDHTKMLVECGLAMRRVTRLFQTPDHAPIVVRVGIHTGFVIAGVVGRKMPRYHLFGETVSIAEEMEQRAPAGHVTVSDATLKAMTPEQWKLFDFAPLDPIRLNGDHRRPQGEGGGGEAADEPVRLIERYIVRSARSALLQKQRQTTVAIAAVRKWRGHKRSKTMVASVGRPASALSRKLQHLRGSSMFVDNEFSSVRTAEEKAMLRSSIFRQSVVAFGELAAGRASMVGRSESAAANDSEPE